MKVFTKIFSLSVLFSIILIGCQKHECMKPKTTATLIDAIITGNDLRACVCCGGLMITFTNNATPYSEKFYDIDQLPTNSGITESSVFPIYVRVNYEISTAKCGNHVNISLLEKR